MALDIVSHGRRGPGRVLRFGQEQLQQIKRTVSHVPEVMVKVSGGGRDSGGVIAHLSYIGRHGKLALETDEGVSAQGKDAGREIAEDWNLDLCRSQYRPKPAKGEKDFRPKLVHNIVLSMPAGTAPEKVLAAARMFARENFALQYRYAMALHTDQPHPHVHLVVKCEHEFKAGERLYIRKDTLRRWREQFAELMREQGVPANATPRQVRGQVRRPLKDPIHHRLRAMRAFGKLGVAERSERTPPRSSSFMRKKVIAIVEALKRGDGSIERGHETLRHTREAVVHDWRSTAQTLRRQGEIYLAEQVERFAAQMPPTQT
ncbi:MAG: relaxase/mobilization nuclease domain-containing protein, partial [Proteobacteria bacterium]|nr:relaxase/mobilization nuclease domain-containing protein [Pseudomonadota bacterium]